MKSKAFYGRTAILLIFLFSSVNLSQTIGKIYKSDEANKLFGNVIDAISFPQSDLLQIANNTQNYLLFSLSNGELTILGDMRLVLYPVGKTVDSNEVFYVYSKSKVAELLKQSPSDKVIFEARQKTLTLSSGTSTLEEALLCPPFCP